MSAKINATQEGEFKIRFYVTQLLSDFPKANPDEDGYGIPGLEEKFEEFLKKNEDMGVICDLEIEDHCMEETKPGSWILIHGNIKNNDLYYTEGSPAEPFYPGEPDEIEGLLENGDVEERAEQLISSFLKDAGLTYGSSKTEYIALDEEEHIFRQMPSEEMEGPDEDYYRE